MKFPKWLSVCFLLFSLVLLFGATLSFTGCGEEFKIKDGKLTTYNGTAEVVTIPNEVTTLGADAFFMCSGIREIIIPPTLTTIEPGALAHCKDAVWTLSSNHPTFYLDNGNLMRRQDKRLIMASPDGKMPSYAESIETGAFANVNENAVVTLPEGLTFLTKAALEDAKFAQLNIGGSVTTLEAFLFKDTKIKRIYVSSVPTIAAEVFGDMKADVVHIDGATTCIEANAFHDSTVDDIYLGESIKLIKNGAVNKVKVSALTVPFLGARNGVTGEETRTDTKLCEIFGTEGSEFSFTASVNGTKISDSLKRVTVLSGAVHNNAFSGADDLETVVLKDGVTGEIAENAFLGVSSTLHLYVGRGVTGFGKGCFYRSWISDTVTVYYYGTEQEWNTLTKYTGSGKDDWIGNSQVSIQYCVPQP